jgi:hypothetical protein
MGLTKEERKARAIAGRLVNALAEVQAFFGDADLIFDDAERIAPKWTISEKQLAEVRSQIIALRGPDA